MSDDENRLRSAEATRVPAWRCDHPSTDVSVDGKSCLACTRERDENGLRRESPRNEGPPEEMATLAVRGSYPHGSTKEGGTNMRAAGEKPDPVGHKGMAGERSDDEEKADHLTVNGGPAGPEQQKPATDNACKAAESLSGSAIDEASAGRARAEASATWPRCHQCKEIVWNGECACPDAADGPSAAVSLGAACQGCGASSGDCIHTASHEVKLLRAALSSSEAFVAQVRELCDALARCDHGGSDEVRAAFYPLVRMLDALPRAAPFTSSAPKEKP